MVERAALIDEWEAQQTRNALMLAAPFTYLRERARCMPLHAGGGRGHEPEIFAGFQAAFGGATK